MNTELNLLLKFSRVLPKIKGAGFVTSKLIMPYYLRKKRDKVQTSVLDFQMILDPHETMDAGALFHPQLYDYKEFETIKSVVNDTDIILDIGANIGFYSLRLAQMVSNGKIISIEAEPYNYSRLTENISLNSFTNITPVHVGLSDKEETLWMGISTSGNKGGNSFLSRSDERVEISCLPLHKVLNNLDIKRINIMKIDIEGFEYRVLDTFFKQADNSLIPKYILAEHNKSIKQENSLEDLMLSKGYKLYKDFGLNKFWKFLG